MEGLSDAPPLQWGGFGERQLGTMATEDPLAGVEILGEHLENSSRKTVIVKVRESYRAYGEMLHYYAVRNLLAYLKARPKATRATMCEELAGPREKSWVNLGGQLVPGDDLARLLSDIKSGRLARGPRSTGPTTGFGRPTRWPSSVTPLRRSWTCSMPNN